MGKLLLRSGLVAAAGLLTWACGDSGSSCGPKNCSGCCNSVGKCVPLTSTSAASCGSGGAQCQSCSSGQCVNGSCGGGGCTNCYGCCQGGQCLNGDSSSACGRGGIACMPCPAGQACSGGRCASGQCDATTNPGGCCYNGSPYPGTTQSLCGKGGQACRACVANEQCINQTCTTATGCTPADLNVCGGNIGLWCPSGTCMACTTGWYNCDRTGPCECQNGCSGTSCSTTSTCNLNDPNVCGGNIGLWCPSGTCMACTTGWYNCDRTGPCECQNGCNGTSCKTAACNLYDLNVCGGNIGQWCPSGTCTACPPGWYNCDRTGTCECQNGCTGTSCKTTGTCNYYDYNVCGGDVSQYCYNNACTYCPPGYYNCDKTQGCECQNGCSGTSCKTTGTCSYYDSNVCGGDTSQWCYNNACTYCSTGFYNCNKTMGCECDEAGCNGSACAGNCLGGEC